MTQQCDFAQSSPCKNILLENASDLFDGNIAFEHLVTAQGYTSISADAELTKECITLLDVERNAERAERVVSACSKVVRCHGVVVVGIAGSAMQTGSGRHVAASSCSCASGLPRPNLVNY